MSTTLKRNATVFEKTAKRKKISYKLEKKMKKTIILTLALVLFFMIFTTPALKIYFPLKYEDTIKEQSEYFNLDPSLVMAVISAESRFDANAQSNKDAKGLMQLKDETAKWCVEHFGLNVDENLFNPETNITIGCSYLEYLIDIFYGEIDTALAAYNAGLGNVRKWLSNSEFSDDGKSLKKIPFKETSNYVEIVKFRQVVYNKLYEY